MSDSFQRFLVGDDRLSAILRTLPAFEPSPMLAEAVLRTAHDLEQQGTATTDPAAQTVAPAIDHVFLPPHSFEPSPALQQAILNEARALDAAQAPRRAAVLHDMEQQSVDAVLGTTISENAESWLRAQHTVRSTEKADSAAGHQRYPVKRGWRWPMVAAFCGALFAGIGVHQLYRQQQQAGDNIALSQATSPASLPAAAPVPKPMATPSLPEARPEPVDDKTRHKDIETTSVQMSPTSAAATASTAPVIAAAASLTSPPPVTAPPPAQPRPAAATSSTAIASLEDPASQEKRKAAQNAAVSPAARKPSAPALPLSEAHVAALATNSPSTDAQPPNTASLHTTRKEPDNVPMEASPHTPAVVSASSPLSRRQSADSGSRSIPLHESHPSKAEAADEIPAGSSTSQPPSLLSPLPATAVVKDAVVRQYTLSADGFGPIRVGMTVAEAGKVLGVELLPADGNMANNECYYVKPSGEPGGVIFMVQRQHITRTDLTANDSPGQQTNKGIRVGDSEQKILQAYGKELMVEPHRYGNRNDHYLTYWSTPDHQRGIRYETMGGKITAIQGGDSSIAFTEGCF